MAGTRLCWAVVLLVIFVAALVAKSEHAVGDGFDGFVQSLSACKMRTQGDGERLVCVTAEVARTCKCPNCTVCPFMT